MSDIPRKDFGDKAQEKLTPDSQKSTLDKASEAASSTGDKVAGAVQPEGDKGIGQKISDSTSTKPGEKGYVEQAEEYLNQGVTYAKETVEAGVEKAKELTGNK